MWTQIVIQYVANIGCMCIESLQVLDMLHLDTIHSLCIDPINILYGKLFKKPRNAIEIDK